MSLPVSIPVTPRAIIRRKRFLRVATRRTNKVLAAITSLGACANKMHYRYTEEEARKIFEAIKKRTIQVERLFGERTPPTFTLEDRRER